MIVVFLCFCKVWSWINNFHTFPLTVFSDAVWHFKSVQIKIMKMRKPENQKNANSSKECKWKRAEPSTWWMQKLITRSSGLSSEWITVFSVSFSLYPNSLASCFTINYDLRFLIWQHICTVVCHHALKDPCAKVSDNFVWDSIICERIDFSIRRSRMIGNNEVMKECQCQCKTTWCGMV